MRFCHVLNDWERRIIDKLDCKRKKAAIINNKQLTRMQGRHGLFCSKVKKESFKLDHKGSKSISISCKEIRNQTNDSHKINSAISKMRS